MPKHKHARAYKGEKWRKELSRAEKSGREKTATIIKEIAPLQMPRRSSKKR